MKIQTLTLIGTFIILLLFMTSVAEQAQAQTRAPRGVEIGGGIANAILGPLLCGFVAYTKGRNPWGWAIFGFFCCPLALLILLFSAPVEPPSHQY